MSKPRVVDSVPVPEEPSDAEIEAAIEDQTALVGPILQELYQHAAEDTDWWLKKSSLKILATWTMNLLDVAQIMEQQLEAAKAVIGSQEEELEKLRPEKAKIWTPFS